LNQRRFAVVGTLATVTAVLAMCMGMPRPAISGNLGFLENSPMANLDAEDTRLLKDAASTLLSTGAAGATRQWENPKSGDGGLVTVVRMFSSSEGFACKTLRFENHAGGWQGKYTAPVCEIKPGDWKIYAEAKPAAAPSKHPPDRK
jgi:surface antigen